MKSIFWQRLDIWARRLIPAGLSIFLVLLTVVPFPVPGYSTIVPMLSLASVFFWAIHHPGLLPAWVVFVIGLVHDILSGALVGSGTVVLLLAYGAVVSQRRFFQNKSFVVVWWGFMLVSLVAGMISWLLVSVFDGRLISPGAVLFQVLLSMAVYPLVTALLHGARRFVPEEA